jgi:outer membrane protein assembly factor BamB
MVRSLALTLLLCSVAPAQPPGGARLRGETESTQTRNRIAEAQKKLADGQTAEAIDQLQRILEESGHELVLVKDNNFQPARRLVQLTLASLPADALKTYRDRMETPARKALDAAGRDPLALADVRDRHFVARPTEQALALLAEMQFERGEFADAERTWRMLLPAADGHDLAYPQPAGDVAGYRAKAILAAFAAGEPSRATKELVAFKKDHPNAKGRLAGAEGNYAEVLEGVRAKNPFAAGRGAVASLPRFPAMRPMWKTPIPRDVTDRGVPRPGSIPAAKTLAFFPAILDGYAYIVDAARIVSFDLNTGDSRIAYDLRQEAEFKGWDASAELALPNLQGVSYALAVSGGKLFAILGPGSDQDKAGQATNALMVFEPHRGGVPRKVRFGPVPGKTRWIGAPVAQGDQVYAAYRRTTERGLIVFGVACYDADSPRRPRWQSDCAEWDSAPAPGLRIDHLAIAGSQVVFTTHAGLTVALDRSTGRMAWAFRNSAATKPGLAYRDASPPLAHGHRVFIAPADTDRLFALDLNSGKPLWESPSIAVQQLIGIADDKVIAAIAGPQKGIRGFHIADGSTREPLGWQNHDDPFLATYGRGFAASNGILWPTMEKLYRINPTDGSVQTLPKPGPHGNLAFGEGTLVVATPTELWAYEGIPDANEPEAPIPPVIRRPPPAPIVAEFDPVQATPSKLPLQLEKTEPGPVAVEPEAGVGVASGRIGFANDHQLVALSANGQLLWNLDSRGRTRPAPFSVESGPRFSPHLLAVKQGVWVQLNAGERWLVSSDGGQILRREKTAEVPWRSPPVALPLGTVAFPDGPGSIRCFDDTFRKHWNYEAGGEASLVGIPPQCTMLGQALLVAIHRNYGIELQRLDPNSGRTLWRSPAMANVERIDWTAAAADRNAFYLPMAGKVCAFDLTTGRELWSAETGIADASAVRGRHQLFVHSHATGDGMGNTLERIAERFFEAPKLERTVGYLGTVAEAAWNRSVAIAAFDPASGRPEGRQEIPAGLGSRVEFRAGKLVVRTPGTVSWWTAKP